MRGIGQLSNAGRCMSNDGHLPRIRAESVERCPQFCHFSKWKREFGSHELGAHVRPYRAARLDSI
jgi:hypothetical protein